MLRHSATCDNTVQHATTQCTLGYHNATCDDTVQHATTQCTKGYHNAAAQCKMANQPRLERTAALRVLCNSRLSSGPILPHLHRDWAHPSHFRTETGLTPPTSAPRLGLETATLDAHKAFAVCCASHVSAAPSLAVQMRMATLVEIALQHSERALGLGRSFQPRLTSWRG